MNGSTWARIEISAQDGYANRAGVKTFPTLQVECVQVGKKHTFSIRLRPGYLDPVPGYQVLEGALLSIKLDQGRPNIRSWRLLNDGSTYEYEGRGESGLGSYYLPKKLLSDLFGAKTFLVAFVPAGFVSDTVFIAEFQPTGLKNAFDRNPECFVK